MVDINDWVEALVSRYTLKSKSELTCSMLKAEIEESEATIRNEEMWCAGASDCFAALQHRLNIETHRYYIEYLRELMIENGNLTEHSLCIGIYSDPDELPCQVVFLLPEGTDQDTLCCKLAQARDRISNDEASDIQEQFEQMLDETVLSFETGYWYYGKLTSLHQKEDLWNIGGGES